MDPNQKRIIVREIEMWRKNRLLPEQYCDFLLNLYMDDPDIRNAILRKPTASWITNSNWKNWLFALAAVAGQRQGAVKVHGVFLSCRG